MATTLTKSYQKIATINLTYGKIYTYAKYTEQNISTKKTTYKIKSTYYTSQANGVNFSSATAKLDGTTKSYGSTTMKKGETTIQELTRTLTHSANGTSPTENISTVWNASYGGSGSSSASIVAPKINVIATIKSGTDFDDEGNPTVEFNNTSNLYVQPYLNWYDSAGTRVYQILGTIAKHSSPYSWNLTSQQRTAMRNATNKQKSYKVAEGVQTYTSSSSSSLISNSANSIAKQMTYDESTSFPEVVISSITEVNPDVISLLGTSAGSTVILNASRLKISTTPTTQKGATVSSIKITGLVNGEITASPYEVETNVLDGSGGRYLQCDITDSRGFTGTMRTVDNYFTIINYMNVKRNSFSFTREDPASADVRLQLDSVYYQQTFGTEPNVPTVKYKLADDEEWTTITLTSENSEIDNINHTLTVDYVIEDAIDYRTTGTFNVEVSDLLSSWTDSDTVPKGIPVFEWGDDEVQVNGDLLLADINRENVINVRDALGGGGGTTDYSLLTNKPQINGVTLSGNKTTSDIGITIPTQTSQLTNNSGFITNTVNNLTNYTKTTDLGTVAISNDYDDLDNKPTIPSVGNNKTYYGTTDDIASSGTYTVSCNNYVLESGSIIYVKFKWGQSYAGTPKLNINDTGAIDVKARNGGASSTNEDGYIYMWFGGEVVGFVYDGNYYVQLEGGKATTSYWGVTTLSSSVSSSFQDRASTPYAVKQAYDLADSKQDKITSTNKLDYSLIDNTPTIPTISDTYSSSSTDGMSGVAVASAISGKQDTLVSGTNLKTINNTSLLGSGNINIGGGGTATDVQVNGTSIVSNNTANITTSMIANLIYPVGSIYMSVNSTNPATLFGGTWEQLKDRFLLGAGDTYTNGDTGGNATHTLSVNEMPSHDHDIRYRTNLVSSGNSGAWVLGAGTYTSTSAVPIESTGGGQAFDIMNPYLVVHMWKRTS